MLREIRRLGSEALVYGLSAVLGRFLNFLLLPFYTHCLEPAAYGLIATLFAYLAFLNVVYQYGMDQSYLRYSADSTPEEAFSAAFWPLLASSLCLSGLLLAFSGPLARLAGLGVGGGGLMRLCAGVLACDALASLPFAELRRAHRAWAYAGVKLAGIGLNAGLNVLFLWRLRMGAEGVFLAALISSAAGLALLLPASLPLCLGRPRFELAARMLRFGLPYVPAGLAAMVVQVIDRPILKALAGDAAVGLYQANYRLGVFMMLVVGTFDAAWRPFFLERARSPGAPRLFGRVLTYFTLGSSWLCLGLSLFIGELVRLPVMGRPLIHPDYWPGLPVVPVVLAAYGFYGLYINFMAQVTLGKRSDLLALATGLGAAANVVANLLLIPRWGLLGAAWATLLAYACMAAALFALGQPLYPVPYEYRRLAHLATALAAVLGALLACRSLLGGTAWIWARLLALPGYPALLWATGFLEEDERRTLSRRLSWA